MTGPEEHPPRLRAPARVAEAAIRQRLASGESLLGRQPRDWDALHRLTRDYQAWSGENRDLLRSLYVTEGPCSEYSAFHGRPAPTDDGLEGQVEGLKRDIITKLSRLGAILWRTITAIHGVEPGAGVSRRPDDRVLLVHAPADGHREDAERLLTALGLQVVTDDLGAGERGPEPEAAPAAYAVVLLPGTAPPPLLLRLGYLLGSLGRTSVTVLRAEPPPAGIDLAGLPCIALDAGGAWKLLLARELRRAGLRVDAVRGFGES